MYPQDVAAFALEKFQPRVVSFEEQASFETRVSVAQLRALLCV